MLDVLCFGIIVSDHLCSPISHLPRAGELVLSPPFELTIGGNAAIKKHLQSKNLSIAVVTHDATAFRDAILAGNPSPLHYDTTGTRESILAEDKLIEAYPHNVNRDRLRIVEADAMFER